MKYKSFKVWFESHFDHQQALNKTGFWGKQGAGSIVLAKKTGRLLLSLRSRYVLEGGTYGTWGGAIDGDENPETAAQRELEEEAGCHGNIDMVPLTQFQKGTFTYHNFLAIVDDEFIPKLNWETESYKWVALDELNQLNAPLHFGLKYVLSHDHAKIQKIVEDFTEQ